MNAVSALAGWAAGASSGHGALAESRAKTAFLDTIACTLLGSGSEVAVAARQSVAAWGSGAGVPALGTGLRLPAPWAAMANGVAAHAFDYDDYEDAANTHPSVALNLADGRQLRHSVDRPRGSPEDPVGDDELAAKFMAYAGGVLPTASAAAAVGIVGRLEVLENLAPLAALLCPSDSRAALAGE